MASSTLNCLLVVLLVFLKSCLSYQADPTVTISDGSLLGSTFLTPNNVSYYGFRGIPYAKPPVGELRFEPPVSVEPWKEVWNATADSSSCLSRQYFEKTYHESEDCLYINVYTPTLQKEGKLSVMVWIYGGGFALGNSLRETYNPDFLIEENVVFVSVNYRVGPFGFLSTADSILPGNMGLKDQTLALKWVQKNIEYFGGDPDKVTIFGQSAGGQSVGYHVVSPLSAGLFRAAILQSGAALMHFIERYPKDTAYGIAKRLEGFEDQEDSQKLKDFMQSKSVDEILTAVLAMPDGIQCWPTLEPNNEGAFMSASPYELLLNGSYNQVPVMIGTAAEESLFFFDDLDSFKEAARIADLVGKAIPYDLFPNQSSVEAADAFIRKIYLKEGETFSNNLLAFAHYFSDRNFSAGILEQAELMMHFSPVYLFQFAYGGRSILEPFLEGAERATHTSELAFLFNMNSEYVDSNTTEDDLVQKRMTKLWTNFAKYINPTPEESELLENVTWPLLSSSEDHPFLTINGTLQLGTKFREDRISNYLAAYKNYGLQPLISL